VIVEEEKYINRKLVFIAEHQSSLVVFLSLLPRLRQENMDFFDLRRIQGNLRPCLFKMLGIWNMQGIRL
jgi:hypothetical protein